MRIVVEIHALQNFAPSNLNRDDTGAPKDAIFGGARRARVSSQCSKRAIRAYFKEKQLFAPDEVAVRTKRLVERASQMLIEKGRSSSEVEGKVRAALAAVELSVDEEKKTQYLLFLGSREINEIVELIHKHWEDLTLAGNDSDELPGTKKGKVKKKDAEKAPPALKKALEAALDGGKAVDLALFGRMLADIPEKNQFASCQVAHAISTHTVDREFDYFTAIDDLKPDETAGSDMIGTVEFNSACFYRYAALDVDLLLKNLQNDQELAKRGVRGFLEGFIVSEPTGKQNTFAAHNPPEFVMVCVRHQCAPISLANAFETPVRVKREDSLTQISGVKLVEKAATLRKVYGADERDRSFVLNPAGVPDIEGASVLKSLKELLDVVVQAMEA